MGWTCSYKEPRKPLLAYFTEKGVLSWPNTLPTSYRILDAALVKLTEFYAALEVIDKATGDRYVTALVFCVKMFPEDRSGFNICYKDMEEDMGPYQTNCPERIMKLLTLTDNENAIAWRKACQDKIDASRLVPTLRKGVVLNFDEPIKFSSGPMSKLVVSYTKGQKIVCTDANEWQWYRLRRPWINEMAASGHLSFS